jgi:hypothetical protein
MKLLKWLFGSRKPALNKPVVSRCNFFQGGRELWKEHHREESERLQNLLIAKGFTSCSIGEAEGLWMSYSDDYAAGFLGMPDTDDELYECIKDQLCVVERNYID